MKLDLTCPRCQNTEMQILDMYGINEPFQGRFKCAWCGLEGQLDGYLSLKSDDLEGS